MQIAPIIAGVSGLAVFGALLWSRRPRKVTSLPPVTPVIRIDPTPLVPHFEAIRSGLSRLERMGGLSVARPEPTPPPTNEEVERIHKAYSDAIREQHEHEATHPVPYSPNVRLEAIVQRAKDKLA